MSGQCSWGIFIKQYGKTTFSLENITNCTFKYLNWFYLDNSKSGWQPELLGWIHAVINTTKYHCSKTRIHCCITLIGTDLGSSGGRSNWIDNYLKKTVLTYIALTSNENGETQAQSLYTVVFRFKHVQFKKVFFI